MPKCTLFLAAYWRLIQFDLYVFSGDFPKLYDRVQRTPVANQAKLRIAPEAICFALDLACVWYWKQALCLQRSAAAVCLLRSYGYAAEMVIGAQQMPFKAHAWAELEGRVMNDKPYVSELYGILDRC